MELDEVLAKRAEINTEIEEILESRVEQWGVNITAVEIGDISLPAEMKRAMAARREAERERRAKIIMSEGELRAAQRLAEAARLMADDPAAPSSASIRRWSRWRPSMPIVLPVPIVSCWRAATPPRPPPGPP
ncbi:MAG: SPFH domain-containing protein [Myxococcales bacterium]|nr:SPFH domain-containing protein [Myxococcales bacterium]